MLLHKRPIIYVITILIFCFALCACSQGGKEETTEESTASFVANFYKLTDEGKTLAIELPADPSSGYNWTYEITDESLFNLSSFQFNPGMNDGEEAVWSATFAAVSEKNGSVQLSLYSVQKLEDVEEAKPVYVMDLSIAADGKITVKSIKQ